MQPLLSICIPTYNRCEYLKKCLDSIVGQNEFLVGRVEVIISDNMSEDNTEAFGLKYDAAYKTIKYFKNGKNIRDKNFPLAISRASGTYRYLCNDTVLFNAGALKKICEIVENNLEAKPHIVWANGSAKCKEEVHSTDFEGYIHDMNFLITSIACFGMWDSECDNVANDTSGCELSLWQVRKGLELASQREKVLIINKPLRKNQAVKNKNISYGLYKVFYENYFVLLQPYFDKRMLSIQIKEYLEKDLLFNFFTDWLIRWELREKDLQYSKTENLKGEIYQKYKDKDYWSEYCRHYRKRMFAIKIKEAIKQIIGG